MVSTKISNAVLITVDSLRADALGAYDSDWNTPVMDSLAENSLANRFQQLKMVSRMDDRQVRKFSGVVSFLVGLAIVGISFSQNDWLTIGLGVLSMLIGILAWVGN